MANDPNDPANPSPSSAADAALASLDFERADGAAHAAPTCAQCDTPITDRYFTIGPHVLCETCQLAFRVAKPPGNAPSRFLGAAALGTAAAAVGCALWMFVTQLTGYEIGLIAIVVGYIVGLAVRTGARHVGGLPYQLLAVFLTYSAVAMTYVPAIANQLMISEGIERTTDEDAPWDESAAPSDEVQTSQPGASPSAPSGDRAGDDGASSGADLRATGNAGAPSTQPSADRLDAWIAAIPLAYMLPFLMGWKNAIGILIIGFALWQAYRMNARPKLDLQGPFRLEARDAAVG